MSTAVQRRRGTTAQHASFAGLEGELTVDTTKDTLVIHDGSTAGGRPLLREDQSNLPTSAPTTGIYNASGSLAISTGGSGRLFVDASGNVQLGSATSTGARLDVTGSSDIFSFGSASRRLYAWADSAGVSLLTGDSQTGTGVYFDEAASNIRFWTGTSEKVRITSAGLVGVGNSSPGGLLHVGASGGGVVIDSTLYSELSPPTATNDAFIFRSTNDGTLNFSSRPASGGRAYRFWRGSNVSVIIDDSGRVGVGTTSPAANLHIQGTTGASLRIQAGSTSSAQIDLIPGGTSNPYYVYVDSSRNFIFQDNASERLRIDSSGRVGIGTSSPVEALTVNGRVQCQWNAFANGGITSYSGDATSLVTGSTAGMWAARSDSALLFSIGSSEKARFDSSGRLGIGTTSPLDRFHVNAGGAYPAYSNLIYGSSADFETTLFLNTYAAGSNCIIANAVTETLTIKAGYASTGNIVFNCRGTERAKIDSSGRLLVGTASSSASAAAVLQGFAGSPTGQGILQLQVGKNTAATAINENLGSLRFANSDGNIGALVSGEADLQWNSGDYPSRLVFSTTPDSGSSPVERLRITNRGYVSTYCDNVSGGYGLYVTSAAGATSTEYLIIGNYGATGVLSGTSSFFVFTNGNVRNTNNSYGAISDIKLKENIVDANSQWDDLKALQVRNYNFKEGQTHTQIGLIAQEVEQVSPGLVTESPDRDADGNDLGTVTKSVNYSVLYMKAVKALQEAMERIETLEQRLNDASIN